MNSTSEIIQELLKEVEEAYKIGYTVGYSEGMKKSNDRLYIPNDNIKFIIDNKLELLKNKYSIC
jgi:hypothetical protein